MPKTPKRSVSFASEAEHDDHLDDEIEEPESDDMRKILEEVCMRASKKKKQATAQFEARTAHVFSEARKRAKILSTTGPNYTQQVIASIMSLRQQEMTYEEHIAQIPGLQSAQDAAVKANLASHLTIMQKISASRSAAVGECRDWLREKATRREESLNQFLADAHAQIRQSREQQMLATDASNLIRHYKNLLLN